MQQDTLGNAPKDETIADKEEEAIAVIATALVHKFIFRGKGVHLEAQKQTLERNVWDGTGGEQRGKAGGMPGGTSAC